MAFRQDTPQLLLTSLLTDWKLIAGFICGLLLAAMIAWCVIAWRRGKAARSGRRGERIVAKELTKLKKKDFLVIHDLLLPSSNGRTSQIDHVVISTRGIFVIETKNHAGRISGGEHAQYWQQHLSSQSRTFYNPLLQNRSHLRAIRRLLKTLDADLFSSMVVFTEAWRLDIKAEEIIKERRFLPDRHIQRTLIPEQRQRKRWWKPGAEVVLDEHKMVTRLDGMLTELTRRPRIISRDSLKEIADRLIAANVTDRNARREHTQYAKQTSKSVSSDIVNGKCPRCGGQLVVRKSPHGEFAGCSNYPSCRFTCSIDRLHR